MKTERELFLEWHFLQWKLHNAVTITVDFAKVLYGRVYSHDHTSSVREVEFKAWCASASREGYKLVPLELADEIEDKIWDNLSANHTITNQEGDGFIPVEDIDLGGIYKAMIGVGE